MRSLLHATVLACVLAFLAGVTGAAPSSIALPPLDSYGGATTIKAKATGHFTIRQVDGRWYFITPEGHGFIPLGVNHLKTYFRGESQVTGVVEPDFVKANDGGDMQRAAERVVSMLREWGFNYAGYDTPAQFQRRLPFSVGFIQVAASAVAPKVEFADVFSPQWAGDLEQRVAALCKPLRGNRNLVGYYLADLPLWGDRKYMDREEKTRGQSWLSYFRSLPMESPGQRSYEKFLAARYAGRWDAFKKNYSTAAAGFDGPLRIDFEKTDRNAPEVVADDEAFVAEIAEQVYRLTREAFRRHDPNHLVLGERFSGDRMFMPVLDRAAKYFPVVAVQLSGPFNKKLYDEIYRRTGRPVISVDHVISFTTPQTPKVRGEHPLKSEKEAATLYRQYLRAAFAEPYMVGYNRCQLVSRIRIAGHPPTYKQGLLDPQGKPYAELLEAVRAANLETLARLYTPR